MTEITLLVFTYQRIQPLYRLLYSILKSLDHCEPLSCTISVIVAFNEPLPDFLNDELISSISNHQNVSSFRLLSRSSNLELDTHLALSFKDCSRGYVWFLSDDDILYPHSIGVVCSIVHDLSAQNQPNFYPPIYLNWQTQSQESSCRSTHSSAYKMLSSYEFACLPRSVFFLSAIIIYKANQRSSIRAYENFAHLACLLAQVQSSGCVAVSDNPLIGYNPQVDYLDKWLQIFLVSLPSLFDSLVSKGYPIDCVKKIILESLANKTGYSTIFYLSSKSNFSSRLFYISAVIRWSLYYPPIFTIIAPCLILLSPLFRLLQRIRCVFKFI